MEICEINQHSQSCDFIRGHYGVMLSEEEREMVVRSFKDGDVSFSDMVCSRDGQAGGVSLFGGLLTMPNGHLTVKEVLDTLKVETVEKIEITLRSGLLFRTGAGDRETRILEDLLKIRRQTQGKGSVAEDAVNGVLTHPVIEALIRQKWHSVRFLFFGHIRY